jgi:peptidoglycan/xylan/chitin deacetylase (PgdA/CDA1 family)
MNGLLAVLLVIPTVVMYHRVDAWAPADAISQRLTISPSQFAVELSELHRLGLRTIGIAELVHESAKHGPRRAVLLTFDDGYGDQYRYAFPILRRFGDRATFFVNTATVGTAGHLTWREVEAMLRAGMSIECHGVDHVDLASLDAAEQTYQIDGCVRSLREHLRVSVLAFAYPSGGFDSETIRLVRQAGMLLGFTTDPRFQRDPRSPYQIARVRVLSGMGAAAFAALVEGSQSYVDFSGSP